MRNHCGSTNQTQPRESHESANSNFCFVCALCNPSPTDIASHHPKPSVALSRQPMLARSKHVQVRSLVLAASRALSALPRMVSRAALATSSAAAAKGGRAKLSRASVKRGQPSVEAKASSRPPAPAASPRVFKVRDVVDPRLHFFVPRSAQIRSVPVLRTLYVSPLFFAACCASCPASPGRMLACTVPRSPARARRCLRYSRSSRANRGAFLYAAPSACRVVRSCGSLCC
jgi:hypothetical protein